FMTVSARCICRMAEGRSERRSKRSSRRSRAAITTRTRTAQRLHGEVVGPEPSEPRGCGEWTVKSTAPRVGPVIGHAKTARGRATRERIVTAASELISERSVGQTSLDDVIDRAGVSKSQLYHYFEDRASLLRAVVDHNTDAVIGSLGVVADSWKAL